MTTATSLPADIKKRGRPLKLIIVTPLLRVDAHAIALNSSLATLRQGGLEFTHIVTDSSLLNKKFTTNYALIGGVPAKIIKEIPANAKYFTRSVGFIK